MPKPAPEGSRRPNSAHCGPGVETIPTAPSRRLLGLSTFSGVFGLKGEVFGVFCLLPSKDKARNAGYRRLGFRVYELGLDSDLQAPTLTQLPTPVQQS